MKRLEKIFTDTTKIKWYLQNFPKLPIVMVVDGEVVADDGNSSWFCNQIDIYTANVLDTDEGLDGTRVYMDESDLREDIFEKIYDRLDDPEYCNGDVDPHEMVEKEVEKYRPYWRECIVIHGRNR